MLFRSGHSSLEDILNCPEPFLNTVVGRYANRIAKGKFTLNNREYTLSVNNGPNSLHGGPTGFHTRVWDAEQKKENSITFTYTSKDGEEGFPGNLKVELTYTLSDSSNELHIDYEATTDKETVVNLTSHGFFNLAGIAHPTSSIEDHIVTINADHYIPIDNTSIPTGEIRSVKNTPMDFTVLKEMGQDINADYEQLAFGNGFDHNWVLNTKGDLTQKAAHAVSESTGIVLDMYTTQPGVQFYSSNFLDGSDIGKDKATYNFRNAFCLETQHFPDCINHKNFASPILKAGEQYNQKTIYKFSVNK